MAIKQIVPIFIQLTGDGSSTAYVFALANVYQQGFGGSVPFGTAGVVPSSVSVVNPPVPVTSSTIDANGNITLTFTSALPASQFSFEIDLTYNSGSSSSASPTQTQIVTLASSTVTLGAGSAVIGHVITDSGSTTVVTGTVASNITQVGGSSLALGQAAMAASIPVVIASNQAVFPVNVQSSGTALTNTGGSLNVNITGGSSGNAAASATGSAVPASAGYTGVNIAGNLVGVTGFSLTNSKAAAMAIVDATGNQITSFGGGSQFAMASAQSSSALGTIALGYDGTNVRGLAVNASGQLQVVFPSAQAVTLTSTTITGSVTVAQATAANLNATVVGTGTFAVQAAQSGTWNIGTVTTITNPVTSVGGAASGASKSGNPVQTGAVFNTTQPTVTTGQVVEAQATARGGLIVATGVDGFNITNAGTFAVQAAQSGTWTVGISASQTIAVTNTGTFAVQATLSAETTKIIGTVNIAASQSVAVTQATAANLNATVVQATGSNLHTVVDSGTITTVSTVTAVTSITNAVTVAQATAANLNATVVQATGTNLHVVVDSGTITASAGALADLVGAAGTLNAANTTATINCFGYTHLGMFLAAGTLIGTIVPEASLDGGTTWVSTFFNDPTTSLTQSSITFGSSNTATSRSIVGVGGASNYRVRVSAFTSGTASCTLRANQVGDQNSLSSGPVATATQPPVTLMDGGWVTTAAPTYSNATLNPLSLTTAGGQRSDLSSVNATALGTPTAFGTTPGAVNALQVNSSLFIGTVAAVAAASGIQKVGVSGNAGGSFDGVIGAATSPANMVVSGGVFTSTPLALTTGQSSAVALDSAGRQFVATPQKATYRAATAALFAAPAATTIFFIITGSGTKTIRVQRVTVAGQTSGTLGVNRIQIAKFSTAPATGTAVTLTQVPLDSNFAAGTATLCQVYTAAPGTAPTKVGDIGSQVMLAKSTTIVDGAEFLNITWDFRCVGDTSPVVLRGNTQGVGLYFNVAPAAAPNCQVEVEWTEE